LTARTNSDVGFWNRKEGINFARWIWLDTSSNDRWNRPICLYHEGGGGKYWVCLSVASFDIIFSGRND
jgi:hypothetical protein